MGLCGVIFGIMVIVLIEGDSCITLAVLLLWGVYLCVFYDKKTMWILILAGIFKFQMAWAAVRSKAIICNSFFSLFVVALLVCEVFLLGPCFVVCFLVLFLVF